MKGKGKPMMKGGMKKGPPPATMKKAAKMENKAIKTLSKAQRMEKEDREV